MSISVKLEAFDGPLDLLLHLINIAQIKIEDVFVSKVTEQFLDYIDYEFFISYSGGFPHLHRIVNSIPV